MSIDTIWNNALDAQDRAGYNHVNGNVAPKDYDAMIEDYLYTLGEYPHITSVEKYIDDDVNESIKRSLYDAIEVGNTEAIITFAKAWRYEVRKAIVKYIED